MKIKQGEMLEYCGEDNKFNLQAEYKVCDIKNKKLLEIKNNGKAIINIKCVDLKIETEIFFDERESPVFLVGYIEKDADSALILICNTQNRIALYINNKLEDEDWPLGKVLINKSVCEAALGDWNIHEDFSFNKNYLENFAGEKTNKIEGWRPAGHNTGAGDCMPFFHEDTLHLFYLFDRRGHRSKWWLGAHQWAHISSKDLINWQEHPMAVSIDYQYEGSICTGSVVYNNNLYYAFYAVRMSDLSPARLSWSVSTDGINFVKSNKYCELKAPYDSPSARDPKVIIDEKGAAHMFVTTSYCYKDGTKKGCLAHLISEDMQNWNQEEPLIILDIEDQPECSDYFYFNGYYYLIYSNFGIAHYFISRNAFGPWEAPENNIVMTEECRVPKTAPFGKDRLMAFCFIPEIKGEYAGKICLKEMIQENGGTFKFIIPEELEKIN